jgi:hypothetical protein
MIPGPEPLPPVVMLNQAALLAAVHLHPDVTLTFAEPVPPMSGKDAVVAESEYEQEGVVAPEEFE